MRPNELGLTKGRVMNYNRLNETTNGTLDKFEGMEREALDIVNSEEYAQVRARVEDTIGGALDGAPLSLLPLMVDPMCIFFELIKDDHPSLDGVPQLMLYFASYFGLREQDHETAFVFSDVRKIVEGRYEGTPRVERYW